jgi:hypothetical protein
MMPQAKWWPEIGSNILKMGELQQKTMSDLAGLQDPIRPSAQMENIICGNHQLTAQVVAGDDDIPIGLCNQF